MYLLTEKVTSTIVMYMILKRLLRPWTEWEAYKQGIIDDKGKRIRKMRTAKDRESFDILDRFCWSIKRLNTKYLGDTKFSYIFSAAYLMKDSVESIYKTNPEKYLTEVSDLTATKQMKLYKILYELDQSVVLNSTMDFETNTIKINTIVHEAIAKHGIETIMEDGEVAAGTTTGDVSQFTPMLAARDIDRTVIQRRGKLLKRRKRK
jgi:hypothetical protein